ncbi:MAG: DNA methyltransferase [Candidatus Rokuibacteriota bacterium]
MEKEQRIALRRAVEGARRLLEQEYSDQLEGTYNILRDGRVLDSAPGDPVVRARLLDVIAHYQAGGASAQEAVARTARECAFTTLNRFVALKMAEGRVLVRECVSAGLQSQGIRELADCAPGLRAALPDGGYQLLLETVMDEISLGLKVLFDRRGPSGLLWPRPKALLELLEILNASELRDLWSEDETIGWVYQYFNGDDARQMREAAAAPRSSRELAVRNQFFTPRYVVEFLTDNTVGRLWYEMRGGRTALRERCRSLVVRPVEVFLGPGGRPPVDEQVEEEVSSGEALQRPAYVLYRPPIDPRDLRILDPACGSGHFLLYAYDLLETIYEEAWEDDRCPASAATGQPLRKDYQSRMDLQRAIPGLILRYNVVGIEIDPRAAQIAALALWLRAQRAYAHLGLETAERPAITRTNIVCAEPMPGERDLLEEFVAQLEPPVLGELVRRIWGAMLLAAEAGSLLKVEKEIENAIREAAGEIGPLLAASDRDFWLVAEDRLLSAIESYASAAVVPLLARKRLFADDASHGIAFADVCRKRFDVVLMNPPFGDPSTPSRLYIERAYPRTKNDLYAAFVERGLEWLKPRGLLGAITSRNGFFLSSFQRWREEILLKDARPVIVADLGYGVMDGAMVEAAAYCLEARP